MAVDLSLFFLEYMALLLNVAEQGGDVRKDIDIKNCCEQYFELQLIEAVFVSNSMNIQLTSEDRQKAIHVALKVLKRSGLSQTADSDEERPLRCHFSDDSQLDAYKEIVL